MSTTLPRCGLRLTSTLTAEHSIVLELTEAPIAAPAADQVVVRIEAAPINPSDLITLLASADPATAQFSGTAARPRVTAQLSPEAAQARAGRIGIPQPVGLEGAGVVVAAGENAEALLGRRVAFLTLARGLFAQYCTVSSAACVPLPPGVSSAAAAAIFVNPMTALAIVETLRQEGYKALIHTAAASNLGQMLVKICQEDGVPLVNIVRRKEQAALLRSLGAAYVCDSSTPGFRDDLIQALKATGASVLFDAIGGGAMAGQVLSAMEAVAAARLPAYSPYGSSERKQVYIYGHLDPSPTQLAHSDYGLIWAVNGWVSPQIMERAGPQRAMELRQRVVDNLGTTFLSHYKRTISLAEALQRDIMIAYANQGTSDKFLINPAL